MKKKPLNELPSLKARIAQEHEWMISRMGEPPSIARPTTYAKDIFLTVRQGDGKYDEAIAAVMWHCRLSAEQAEDAIGDLTRMGRPFG